jgi:hypothetical protein
MNISKLPNSRRRQLQREFTLLTDTVPGQNMVAYKNFLHAERAYIDETGRLAHSLYPYVAELPTSKSDHIDQMWQWLRTTYGNPTYGNPDNNRVWIYLEHSRSKNYVRFGFMREQDRNWFLLAWK